MQTTRMDFVRTRQWIILLDKRSPQYFPVIAIAEIKSILKTSGENYKVKMTDIEKQDADKFYIAEVEHAH